MALSDERLAELRERWQRATDRWQDEYEAHSLVRSDGDDIVEALTELESLRPRAQRQYRALDVLMRYVRIPMSFVSPAELERWWAAWEAGWDAIGMTPPTKPSDGVDGVEMVRSREIAWKRAEAAEAEVDRLRARVATLEPMFKAICDHIDADVQSDYARDKGDDGAAAAWADRANEAWRAVENAYDDLPVEDRVGETENDRLRAANAELVAVLREVEWVTAPEGLSTPPEYFEAEWEFCPRCKRFTFDGPTIGPSHAPDCALDAALRGGE